MYKVSVKLIVSDRGFCPDPDLIASRHFHRAWKEGDLVVPQATKRFDDAGVAFRLLHEYTDADWAEVVLFAFEEVAAQIATASVTTKFPTPHLSVFVETDGSDSPPIFLSRELLDVVVSIKGEVDVDIVNSI
ncbi:MAG: hypothetical protein Q8N51_05070 [Gammaproteobacteria bacterium]|nr:hypothetical protein [Gammaproteobacteria bacterium]